MTIFARDTARQRLADWYRQWAMPLRRQIALNSRLSSADVEDVAQEVFLRILRYERAELVSHPQAYLSKIAFNVLAEWSTRASWRQPHASEWLVQLTDECDPAHEFACEDTRASLRSAVKALPLRTRAILRMHYQDGLTHEGIAQKLSITRRMVKRDLSQAYADLRRSIGVPIALATCAPSRGKGK